MHDLLLLLPDMHGPFHCDVPEEEPWLAKAGAWNIHANNQPRWLRGNKQGSSFWVGFVS